MKLDDIFKYLPIVTEVFGVGRSRGRPCKMKVKHLDIVTDMIDVFIKNIREDMESEVNPTAEQMKMLAKALQLIGNARLSYSERVKEIKGKENINERYNHSVDERHKKEIGI